MVESNMAGVLKGEDPNAGEEFSITTDYDYVLSLIRISFVTSATAGQRVVHLRITAESEVIYDMPIYSAITESTNAEIIYGGGMPWNDASNTSTDAWFVPFPRRLNVPRGSIIETVTNGLDAGDNFGKVILYVERYT